MNGTDTFLDINNANLRVNSGNVQASAFILDQIDFIASSNASTTVGFNNATTAFLAASNIEVGTANLFVDTTTSNVGIGTNAPLDTLHVKGGTLIDGDLTVNGTISAPSTSLQAATDTGNVTSNTVQFSNAITSLTATSNIEVAGFVGSSGTGALTVPSGTTEDRPTPYVAGMIRYNSTTGFMEAYSGGVWAPIAQPPTVTGVSPLSTLTSGGIPVGWNTGTKIVAPLSDQGANDNFGWSVAMNSDGTKVVVGVKEHDTPGYSNSGAAYIYTYSGGSWDAGIKIVAFDGATNDEFGRSVSMSGDGTKVIVGAWSEDMNGSSDAGSAYIFTYDGLNWDAGIKIPHLLYSTGDKFGWSVDMSSDGTKVIVGAPFNDNVQGDSGAAYTYTYDSSSSTWGSELRIKASDAQSNDYFGDSVAMSGDGNKIIVGAHAENSYAGSVYIFTYDSLIPNWGSQVKIDLALDKAPGDYFGWSVAMSGDGNKIIVGARSEEPGGLNDAGSAYIFTYGLTNYNQWDAGTKIVASDGAAPSDHFGWSVAMNSDGTKVIVGAYNEDPDGISNAGSAYIFTYSDGSWDLGTKIVAPDKAVADYFGQAVSISGDGNKVIVGANQDTSPTTSYAGSASIFDYQATELFDASTQVFTATGTGIVSGSTVQLEGANGTLYSVVDATPPNAAGTQVTFKMGARAVDISQPEFPPSAMSTNTSITGYVASASYNSSDAWRAFNGVVSTSSSDYWPMNVGNTTRGYFVNYHPYLAGLESAGTQDISGTSHRGHWVQLQIPTPVILSRAVIGATSTPYQIGQFVILGSNDNTNWTLLHAGDNTNISSNPATPQSLSTNVTTLSAGSTEAFSYFRVVIKSKGIGYNFNLEINNIQFFGGIQAGSWDLAQQPYKVRINSTSGLTGTSTAKIGFPVGWTSPPVDGTLTFDPVGIETETLVGTDGAGGTNRTFSVAPGSNPLPAKVGGGNLVLTTTPAGGEITGQIAATGTTPMTFRLTDNASLLFTDRAIDIVGVATPVGQQTFTSTGTSTWVAPANVTSVCVVCVGGGGGGGGWYGGGGGGGGLAWRNNVTVIPGTSYTVTVGAGGVAASGGGGGTAGLENSQGRNGGTSSFLTTSAGGGQHGNGYNYPSPQPTGGTYTGEGGGNGGGCAGNYSSGSLATSGGGGAGGYSGTGGKGAGSAPSNGTTVSATAGAGGGGGGGGSRTQANLTSDNGPVGGGGVGLLGQGANGAAGVNDSTTAASYQVAQNVAGGGGSGGGNGNLGQTSYGRGGAGGLYGGGGGPASGDSGGNSIGGVGGNGAVRIIWGSGRSFPSNAA